VHHLYVLNTNIFNEPVKELGVPFHQRTPEICDIPHHLCVMQLEKIKHVMLCLAQKMKVKCTICFCKMREKGIETMMWC
jgi:hypothetical protein